MQRYFIEKSCIDGDIIHIDSFNHKHIQKVMRYQNGDSLICILPNEDVYIGVIKDIDSGTIQLVEKREENQELDVDVTLIYGLPKHDKFEFVLQKATELGVNRIVPFLSKRSIIKTDEKTFSKKRERHLKILKEAAEQSYRTKIPTLCPLIKSNELQDYLSDVNLVAYEESSKEGEHTAFKKALDQDLKSITIIVGPEGGFDDAEIEYMKNIGVQPCSLGKRILRSETAPLYMLSVIGYRRELE